MSESRAKEVVRYLASKGLHDEQLVATGWGEKRPIASNGTREGKSKNRRVEFHIMNRESERGIRQLMGNTADRSRVATDRIAMEQLRAIATGRCGVANPSVLRAAANVVLACSVDWDVERLLWIARMQGDPQECPLSRVDAELIRLIMQWYIMKT